MEGRKSSVERVDGMCGAGAAVVLQQAHVRLRTDHRAVGHHPLRQEVLAWRRSESGGVGVVPTGHDQAEQTSLEDRYLCFSDVQRQSERRPSGRLALIADGAECGLSRAIARRFAEQGQGRRLSGYGADAAVG
jgi:hypothetical protein